MRKHDRSAVVVSLLLLGIFAAGAASAQKPGGVLKMYHRDSPASASIHEEATFSTNTPFMGVFNNLVMYKQDVAQNTMDSIVPDLATSWAWSADRKRLTFKLREGVKWHDGKPFTAKDVKCTFDMVMDKSPATSARSPSTATSRRPSCCIGRSRRCSRCSPRAIRRSIPATCRRATCAPSPSAPDPSSS